MILPTELLVNIAIISMALLLFSGRNPLFNDPLWLVIHSLILGSAAAIFIFQWSETVYLLLAFSLMFVVLPLGLMLIGWRLNRAGQGKISAHLLRVASLLHPTMGWKFNARLVAALTAPSRREQCAGLEGLEAGMSPGQALIARLHRLRLSNDWAGLMAMAEPKETAAEAVPLWIAFRLQALAELGRLDEMAAWYFDNQKRLQGAIPEEQALFPLVVFSGKYQYVEALLRAQQRDGKSDGEAAFWVTNLARLIAGQETVRPALEAFAAKIDDPMRRDLFQQRLATPLPDPRNLSAGHSDQIDQLADDYLARARTRPPRRLPRVTLLMLVAIIAGYGYEWMLGGPDLFHVLVQAGGMYPPFVDNGDWWRLGTALFLHLGWLHLVFNLLALYVLGSAVEKRLGWWRTLIIYGLGGVLSSAFVYKVMVLFHVQHVVLVGASGAIMALLGALTALVLADWIRTRAARDKKALGLIVAVITLQVISDFLVPNVSFNAHLSGFVVGLGIAVIFILFKR